MKYSDIICYKPQLSEDYYMIYYNERDNHLYTKMAFNYISYIIIKQCCIDLVYIINQKM